jgi:hypothetical protein
MRICFTTPIHHPPPSYSEGKGGENNSCMFLDLWWLGHCDLFLRDFLLNAVGVKNILVWSSQFSANAELGNFFYNFLEITTRPQATCPPHWRCWRDKRLL